MRWSKVGKKKNEMKENNHIYCFYPVSTTVLLGKQLLHKHHFFLMGWAENNRPTAIGT
jgi:hypothetical protein